MTSASEGILALPSRMLYPFRESRRWTLRCDDPGLMCTDVRERKREPGRDVGYIAPTYRMIVTLHWL